LGLETLQGRRLHSLAGQPIPLLGCPQGEKLLLVSALYLSSFYIYPLSAIHLWKEYWLYLLDNCLIDIERLLLADETEQGEI